MMFNGRYRELTLIVIVVSLTAVATYTSLHPTHAGTGTISQEAPTNPAEQVPWFAVGPMLKR
jgi:hypothetical protein